jgi:putative transposase
MARWNQPISPDELLDQILAAADPKTFFAKDGLIEEWARVWADDITLGVEVGHRLDRIPNANLVLAKAA